MSGDLLLQIYRKTNLLMLMLTDRGTEGRNKQNINPAMLRSIQKFANYEKLKRVMLMIVAFSMDKSKLVGLRDAFIMLDSGKEGTISLSEFRNGLEKFGISDEEASKLYSAVDMVC